MDNPYVWEEAHSTHNFGDMIGEGPAIRKVTEQIQLVAPTAATVLVTGESGTGKELVARAIHDHSPRKNRALVKVNCSATPAGLFESEFFGHVKGAFTGALKNRLGRFELADGGTLFLDEISEIPLPMQTKLLRVLQEHELERVGDTLSRKVDVRIVAASNRELEQEVDAGRFRRDLYYRLNVFPIKLPPLRERRDDIPALVVHFVRQTARRMSRAVPCVTEATMSQLISYEWPGNVRELQNAIERAAILAQGDLLQFDWLEASNSQPADGIPVLTSAQLKQRERENLMIALAQADGRVFGPSGAAARLGMKPTTVISRIKALGLERHKSSE
ncbi:MAG: sigma 54-interacting transcriptional regulator [Chthoniobacterales bacterium]